MKAKRERKHAQIDVSGNIQLEPQMPGWEADLLLAALARLVMSEAGRTPREMVDAAR